MRVSRPWADQAAELLGAASLAAGAGFSAWRVAPVFGSAALPTASAVAVAGMIIGWALVRLAPGATMSPLSASFESAPIEVGDVLEQSHNCAPLDPQAPGDFEESRVVKLFVPLATPTAGELQGRIEAHLGHRVPNAERSPAAWDGPSAIPDASDTLYAALDDLRRSLRRS